MRRLIFTIAFISFVYGCGTGGGDDPGTASNSATTSEYLTSSNLFFDSEPDSSCQNHLLSGVPSQADQFICRDAFALGYNYEHKIADWASYHITDSSVTDSFDRNDNFREDLEIPEQYRAGLEDYVGSGYDRGHLVPAATVDYSYQAMDESFLLSNISPQSPELNRGAWASLESYIRDCAVESGELYVVTGTIKNKDSDYIGDLVTVPDKYYVAALREFSRYGATAFVLPNADVKTEDLGKYMVSVDALEQQAGVDLFSSLRDSLETSIESQLCAICETPWESVSCAEYDAAHYSTTDSQSTSNSTQSQTSNNTQTSGGSSNNSGCCSWHGGLSSTCGSSGYWICNDGTSSPSCRCK